MRRVGVANSRIWNPENTRAVVTTIIAIDRAVGREDAIAVTHTITAIVTDTIVRVFVLVNVTIVIAFGFSDT